MSAIAYRVESSHPLMGPLLPVPGAKFLHFLDRSLAIVLASKSRTYPSGHEIRVVHVPTGEIIFRKDDAHLASCSDGF
jgi:hypothetical protein